MRSLAAILTPLVIVLTSLAPSAASAANGAERHLERQLGPGVEVEASEDTGRVSFVGADRGSAISPPEAPSGSAVAVARAFLNGYPASFGVSGKAADLVSIGVRPGARGDTVVRLQQRVEGVPVVGGEFAVTVTRAGEVLSVLGEAEPVGDLDTAARTPAGTAVGVALGAVAKAHGTTVGSLRAGEPELSIYDSRLLGGPGLERPLLVWRLEVTAEDDPSVRELVLVDARRGHVALHFNQVAEALNRSVCNANNTASQVPCTTPVRSEGGPATGNVDVDRAYDYSGDTYNFYFSRFGRDSLNGSGMALKSTVRYCEPGQACPYQNAFWNGQQMVYGQGFAAADDVVGHELTHGVTEFSSNLFYYYQSGAINESLSDVFGELIDLSNGAGNDSASVRWRLGEDLAVGAIRDMANPPAFGDPDRMTSSLYYGGTGDSGGVHTNSGVNNKAASLMTDGGTFNGQTVSGLGIEKVARIYYTVETSLLTSGSDYADLGNALQQACTNLVGSAGITSADCTEVAETVAATQMSTSPPAAPAPEAPVCGTGLTPTDVFSDGMETATGWTTLTAAGQNSWGYATGYATSGVRSLYGQDRSTVTDTSIVSPAIAIPASVPSGGVWAHFRHAYDFEGNGFDGGVLEYSTNGGSTWVDARTLIVNNGYTGTISGGTYSTNPLRGRQAFVGVSRGYISSRVNLASLAGRSVKLRFRIGTDSSVGDLGWLVDDLRVYTCGGGAPTQRTLTVAKAGTGTGTVTSSPAGITCGAICTAQFADGASVVLTAAAASGSTFAGWSGCDSVSGNQCTLAMGANRSVTATFNASAPTQRTLTVNKGGTGSGTVTSSPAGINCGATCSAQFADGATVVLTATPASGSTFGGWSGCNSVSGNQCTVSMNASRTVTATFRGSFF